MSTETERLKGSRITKDTGCRVGSHVFTYTSLNEWTRCRCGMFTWEEWIEEEKEG